MAKLTVAVQMDKLSSVDPAMDSTLMLMREAARRGYALHYYTPDKLSLKDGMPVARACPLTLREGTKDFYTLGEPRALPLIEADVVLMRQDPPFDMAYISNTYMLEALRGKTLVLNDPAEVRNNPEKLFPLQFPQFIPPTLISASAEDIRAFHRGQGEIVLKPLYGHGGMAVFLIDRKGSNLAALLEMFFAHSKEPLVAQQFLPEVMNEERRITVIDGRVVGQISRRPAEGDIRSNMHVGGKIMKAELSPRQRDIATAIGAVLREKGILFAGLDLVKDKLLEINITSPGGLPDLKNFYGLTPERDFWDAAERLL